MLWTKKGGLLIRIDSESCDFKEKIESIPIDRRDLEIGYLTVILSTKKYLVKRLRNY